MKERISYSHKSSAAKQTKFQESIDLLHFPSNQLKNLGPKHFKSDKKNTFQMNLIQPFGLVELEVLSSTDINFTLSFLYSPHFFRKSNRNQQKNRHGKKCVHFNSELLNIQEPIASPSFLGIQSESKHNKLAALYWRCMCFPRSQPNK